MKTLFKNSVVDDVVLGMDTIIVFDKFYMIQITVDVKNPELYNLLNKAFSELRREVLSLQKAETKGKK